MEVTCPFCRIAGEIPDQSNPGPLRCRRCGTKFQPNPPTFDDWIEHVIDVDHLVSPTPTDLDISLDEEFNVYRPRHAMARKTKSIGPLGFLITIVAALVNCFLLSIFVKSIADDLYVLRRAKASSGGVAVVVNHGNPAIVSLDQGRSSLGWSMLGLSFVGSLPLLGAYVSRAKRRGLAEGYNLVTFFSCLGLIVALCLPTNREGD